MVLKRKRSDPDFSPLSTTSSADSRRDPSSPCPSDHVFSFNFQVASEQYPRPQFVWPGAGAGERLFNASGRTRKRVRDNRPDEQVLYANTFRKLFDAQRTHGQPQTSMSDNHVPPMAFPDAMDTCEASVQAHPGHEIQAQPKSQSSLHKFFNISRAPISNAMPVTGPSCVGSGIRCQDCERNLGTADDDLMLDEGCNIDGSGWGCRLCGRTVCDLCAVVDTGAGRECLMCRTG